MTTYTALKLCETFKLDHCQSLIVVPENVTRICGTTASLNPDDILSINDLLYGIMLPSGNDAAFTLANFMGEEIIKRKFEKDNSSRHINPNSDYNHIPGVRAFLKHMNHNAWELDMLSSYYDSPHGLSNTKNFSSSLDQCMLISESMKLEKFRNVVRTKAYFCSATDNTWTNTNKLLDEGYLGVKTGITPSAGPCLSTCVDLRCKKFGKAPKIVRLVVVTLNSASSDVRWAEMPKLVNWVGDALNGRTKKFRRNWIGMGTSPRNEC